jgi:DNA-binding response OmpR family regulator
VLIAAAERPGAPVVLVADGDDHYRSALSTALERDGFDVVTAADSHVAAELVARSPIAVALLATEMLLAVLPALQTRNVRVVVIGDAAEHRADLVLGVDDYIVKPFRMRELIALLRKLTTP